MKIAVIGSGYVGTVTGTCLAELGHDVICSDMEKSRIEKLNRGELPFFEAQLEPLLRTNVDEGRLRFTTDTPSAVRDAEVVFLCVGTPPLPNGKPDMKSLEKAIHDISTSLTGYTLIVEKSTLPIRTGEWLVTKLREDIQPGAEFDVAAVPQFLREGYAVHDFMKPDLIVIGAANQRAVDILVQIYHPLNSPLLITDINSAELIKHASNAFLAMKISFINSIAQICEKTGADITKVAKGIGLDRRINHDYLNAGVGYGGIFFPKDISSLLAIADEYSLNLDLLKSVETINRYQRLSFIVMVEKALDGVEGKSLCLWGLAYRPNTDDMRDAPSLTIIRSLQKRGAKIKAYDPIAMEATREIIPHVQYAQDAYEAAQGVDAILILTEWEEFERINFKRLRETTQCRLIIDGRNLYQTERMAELGFTYISMGRQEVQPKTGNSKTEKKPSSSKKSLEKV